MVPQKHVTAELLYRCTGNTFNLHPNSQEWHFMGAVSCVPVWLTRLEPNIHDSEAALNSKCNFIDGLTRIKKTKELNLGRQ